MSSLQEVKMNVNQIPIDLLTEGDKDHPAISKWGQLFTADWVTRLVMAGLVYRMSTSPATGGADITALGTGTTTDLDIMEGLVTIDSGFLIPIEIDYGFESDLDADADEIDFLMTADRDKAVTAAECVTGAGTVEAPSNLLDGAGEFGGRAYTLVTVNVIDPAHTEVLLYQTWSHAHLGTAGSAETNCLRAHKLFTYPDFIAGPCSIQYYYGGTELVLGLGSFVFAHIPAAFCPTV